MNLETPLEHLSNPKSIRAAAKDAKDSKASSKKKAKVVEDSDEEVEDDEDKEKDEEKEKEKPKRAQRKGGVSIPEEWPWEEAKKVFQKPDVTPANEVELEWKDPDVDGLVQFLVNEKGFKCVSTIQLRSFESTYAKRVLWPSFVCYSEERVRKGAEKLTKYINAKQQGRLDGFFSSKPKAFEPSKDDDKKGKGKGKATAKGKDDGKKGTKRKVSRLQNLDILLSALITSNVKTGG